MKFKCGPTQEEILEYITTWHDYFAWWPTKVADGDCRWMETIERKADYWNQPPMFQKYRAKKKWDITNDKTN